MSLLTNRAIPASEINAGEAETLLETARTAKPRTEAEFTNRDRDLERARRMRAMSRNA